MANKHCSSDLVLFECCPICGCGFQILKCLLCPVAPTFLCSLTGMANYSFNWHLLTPSTSLL